MRNTNYAVNVKQLPKKIFTEEEVSKLVPTQYRLFINKNILDLINNFTTVHNEYSDALFESVSANTELLIDNVSTSTVSGLTQLERYTRAIMYTTLVQFGTNRIEAFKYAYPETTLAWFTKNKTYYTPQKLRNQFSAYVGKFVLYDKYISQIIEKTMKPAYITFAPVYEETLKHLYKIGTDVKVHPRDRVSALGILAGQLKAPIDQRIEVNLSKETRDYLSELRSSTNNLADEQLSALQSGKVSIQEIIEAQIIKGEDSE
jgi:hypothetical protein